MIIYFCNINSSTGDLFKNLFDLERHQMKFFRPEFDFFNKYLFLYLHFFFQGCRWCTSQSFSLFSDFLGFWSQRHSSIHIPSYNKLLIFYYLKINCNFKLYNFLWHYEFQKKFTNGCPFWIFIYQKDDFWVLENVSSQLKHPRNFN